MAPDRYDVIVIGARCAGSPTAMLLARQGHRVLLVDRATFPSDTLSTHVVHPPGVAALDRWGVLDRLRATDCPPIDTYSFDFGPFTLAGAPGTPDSPVAYCPRRTVLDKLLVDAAAESGVEVREAFTVDEIVFDDGRVAGIRGHAQGGGPVVEHGDVVVGADGRFSLLAKAVGPEQYHERSPILCGYYSYWSGLPAEGRFAVYGPPGARLGGGADPRRSHAGRRRLAVPRAATRTSTTSKARTWGCSTSRRSSPSGSGAPHASRAFAGTAVENYFRKPFGPGWALVGDAGYNKDFITAQGITDAFRDAELCADALHARSRGPQPFDEVMAEYQATRDEHVLPMFEFTCQLATLEPPPPEMQQLLGAMHGNQDAMDGFARVNGGSRRRPSSSPRRTSAAFSGPPADHRSGRAGGRHHRGRRV